MSEKTYTAAEVAELLAQERAKASKNGAKREVRIFVNSGTFKPTSGKRKGVDTPFSHISIEGNFYPAKLSFAAAEAVLSNLDALKAALKDRPKVEAPSALTTADQSAPRLVTRS